MTLIVDASVALRWYVEAPGTPEALALLDRDEPLLAPDLLVVEVANAAWKLARAGEINREHGERIAAAVASAFDHLVVAARLASRAWELACELDHPVYDCLYLSLAEIEDCSFVTADRRLLERVAGSRLRDRVVPLLGSSR